MPEKSTNIFTGQAAVQAPTLPHPHAAVCCSIDCSSLMAHGAADPQITAQSKLKVLLSFPTPSPSKKVIFSY